MKSVPTIDCCMDCVPPERHIGCHGTCETYIKLKAQRDNYNQERYKQSAVKGYKHQASVNKTRRSSSYYKSGRPSISTNV